MADPGHLNNPPIIEAVLDLRVRRREGITADVFAQLEEEVGTAYTEKKVIGIFEAKLGVPRAASTEAHHSLSSHVTGYRYEAKADDLTRIGQFKVSGFSYNLVGLYDSWESLTVEAARLWSIYQSVAQPTSLVRLGVRFINRFTGLAPPYDPMLYLQSPIPVPKGIKGETEGFHTRVLQEYAEYAEDTGAVINQVLENIGTKGMRLILDIDAFILLQDEHEMPTPLPLEEVASLLDRLRTLKNNLFFESVTNDALEPYR